MSFGQYLRINSKSTVENRAYYRPDIDGLRGIAVGIVILYHLFPLGFKYGYLGVDIFFVISGYVVTQALQNNLSAGYLNGILEFYSRRIKRILPALYFHLTISITLCCLLIPPFELQSFFKTAATAAIGASNIGLLYARFNYFSPDLSLNPFVHTWSLGVEEQFYFLFPSLLIMGSFITSKRNRLNINFLLISFLSLSLIYWATLQFNAPVAAFYNPMSRFWELLVGAILYINKESIVHLIGIKGKKILQYIAITLLGIVLFMPVDFGLFNYFVNVFIVLSSALIIAIGINTPSLINNILGAQPLVWIGKLSYSLYLWHYTIFAFMEWNYDKNSTLHISMALMLVLTVSILSYRFIELPFRYASVKGVKVIFIGMAACFSSLAFMYILYVLPPSQMYLGNSQYYTDLWPAESSELSEQIELSYRQCHLEYLDDLSRNMFEKCSTKSDNKNSNHIYLVGNSHAQHLVPMLESVSRKTGHGYTALTISSCVMVSALQIISSINYRFDICKNYFDYALDFIANNAKKGDKVLFGARSLYEKPTNEDMDKLVEIYIDEKKITAKEAYDKTTNDLASFSKLMNEKGVNVIFAGPTPEFDLTVTQCIPEWFRINRKECKTPLETTFREKEKYLESIADIKSETNNVYLWDPLSVLCEDTSCTPFKNGNLLFRDKHHLSLYGSRLLAPGFIDFIQDIN